jgi:hypothetical protein
VFLFLSCKKSTEPIGDSNTPGYQEEIPWPSLADSPWPMNHGDPQSTGRSKFTGPIADTIIEEVEAINIQSGVSIGPDSTIYFCSGGDLVACSQTGKLNGKLNRMSHGKDSLHRLSALTAQYILEHRKDMYMQ